MGGGNIMQRLNENIFHQYNKWKKNYTRKENSIKIRLNEFLDAHPSYKDYLSISEDGKSVNCSSSIFIYDIDLSNGRFPFPFGTVNGDFDCSVCSELISLEGAPEKVDKNFNCSECSSLTSLKGAPQIVGGDFVCDECLITSLEGAPEEVGGDFNCSECHNLTSLKGAPKKVGHYFTCYSCKKLTSLEGAPEEVGAFYCPACTGLTSLEGLPKIIKKELTVPKRFKDKIPNVEDIDITCNINYYDM